MGDQPSRRAGFLGCIVAALGAVCVVAWGVEPDDAFSRRLGVEPFFRTRSVTATYAGPGRCDPDPTDLTEVRIGWFAPSDPADPRGGPLWCAATLAVEEANAAGGYKGVPFCLVPRWSENPWGTGVSQLTRLVYREKVWALIGSADGGSTHLAEQVVAKARLALVSPVSTDKTVNLANVPWVFSLAPGDHVQAPVLAPALLAVAGERPFVVLSATGHDARMLTAELLLALRRRQATPALHLTFTPGVAAPGALALQMERTAAAGPAAIVVIAGAADSARVVRSLHTRGLEVPVFGSATMGRALFIEEAGEAGQGVVFPLLFDPEGNGRARQFARRFEQRSGCAPDYAAAHAYDATRLLIAAIRQGGLNRVRIRDALQAASPWQGVTGTIRWDPTGQNLRRVSLATIREGRTVALARGSIAAAPAAFSR